MIRTATLSILLLAQVFATVAVARPKRSVSTDDNPAVPSPKILGLKAGVKVQLLHAFEVSITPVPGAIALTCSLDQGDNGVVGDVQVHEDNRHSAPGWGDRAHSKCRFAPEDMRLVAGPATLTLRVHTADGWGPNTELPVEVVPRPVLGGGKAFDERYWSNVSGGQGALSYKEAIVKNGVMTVPLSIGETSVGVVHAKVETDGMVLPQIVKLPPQKPPVDDTDEYSAAWELARATQVEISGYFHMKGDDHIIELTIVEGTAKPNASPNHFDATLVRSDGHGAQVSWCDRDSDCAQYGTCCRK